MGLRWVRLVTSEFAAERRRQGHKSPDVDAKALQHDKTLVKSLLDSLCTLAQDRLLGIINNRRKAVAAIDTAARRPAFPPHTQATRPLNGPIK